MIKLLRLVRRSNSKAKEVLMDENNVVSVAAPASLVGDIHGQFSDFMTIVDKVLKEEDTWVFLVSYND